jgi:hypothetical protein
VILKAFNYLVDNLDGLSPSALALSDLFWIATTFGNKILDVEHVARKLVIIFGRESESSTGQEVVVVVGSGWVSLWAMVDSTPSFRWCGSNRC